MIVQVILMFFAYAFIGWIIEVLYHARKHKRFVNRGFLNSPLVPIYGISMVFLHLAGEFLFQDFTLGSPMYLLVVFVFITVLSTLLEFIGGAALYHLFDARWWDYSEEKFNYKGYVCLRYSLIWGALGTAAFTFVHHPFVVPALDALDETIAYTLTISLLIVLAIDYVFTLITLINFKTMLQELKTRAERLEKEAEEFRKTTENERFRGFKDTLSNVLFGIRNDERISNIKSRVDQLKAYMSSIRRKETKKEFNSLKNVANRITESRLYKAFPKMKIGLKKRDKDDDSER